MANQASRTEHTGAKKGKGAYGGRKRDAKPESNRRRREDDKEAAIDTGDDTCSAERNPVTVRPERPPRLQLENILRGITPRKLQEGVDTGGSVGRETW